MVGTPSPSPGPRGPSVGPPGLGGMTMPPQQQLNGSSNNIPSHTPLSATHPHQMSSVPPTPTHAPPPQHHPHHAPTHQPGPAAPPAPMSQQNLNQIVIDYLAKKGYNRTEATLRMESASQEATGRPVTTKSSEPPAYAETFAELKVHIDNVLDLYQPELRRVLWPLFVHIYLNYISEEFPKEGLKFYDAHKNDFEEDHSVEVTRFRGIQLPDHVTESELANKYRKSKYRVTLTKPAFELLVLFLEQRDNKRGMPLIVLLGDFCNLVTKEREEDTSFGFGAMLARANEIVPVPAEDEGIPGHTPGSAYTGNNPALASVLPKLKLGKLVMDGLLEEDVRGDLKDLDDTAEKEGRIRNPTLIETFDQMIKNEDGDEFPTRAEIPFPGGVANRDIEVEVSKVRQHRDRVRFAAPTPGVAPPVSICMFTFHNTYDSANCVEISDDYTQIAAGFEHGPIRIWSVDGGPLKTAWPTEGVDYPNKRHMYGHAGAVYAVRFQPSARTFKESLTNTAPAWLLSCGKDGKIILWNLTVYAPMVIYDEHAGPVFDVQWGPFGHYFVSGGEDKSSRLFTTDHKRSHRLLIGHDRPVEIVAWHPNSAYCFTGSEDGIVRMWAISNGHAVRMLTGHKGPITTLKCSNDGKTLASADENGIIILWDLASGRLKKLLRGHRLKTPIWALDFSVDDDLLISGGQDCSVRLWDTGKNSAAAAAAAANVSLINSNDAETTTTTNTAEGTAPTTATTSASNDKNAKRNSTSAAAGKAAASSNPTNNPSSSKTGGKNAAGTYISTELLVTFATKMTPVYSVKFTRQNLALSAGPFLPELAEVL